MTEALAAAGQVSAPASAPASVPVPLADLFRVAVEKEQAGQLEEARRFLGYILASEPDQPDALHLAGVVAYRLGDRAEALELMRRSLAHGLDTPLHWRNICEVLRTLGKLDEALAAGRRAVRLNPDDPVALVNLTAIHAERLEFDAAERCARDALALDPASAGAHFGLAEILLQRGDFARGWREYEWRFDMPGAHVHLPPGPRRMWQGEPLPGGRLLLIADQGFGDVIQFGRFIPWALQRCPDAPVACSAEMRPILAQYGAARFYGRWEDVPPYDAYAPLSELPRLYGMTAEHLPTSPAWLHAEPEGAARWRERLDQLVAPGFRRIGLVWAGRPSHLNDYRRSMPLASLAPLFDLERVALVSLQKGERRGEAAAYAGLAPLVNLGPELMDWNDTLAVIDGLEAVVAVDTGVAHLAGAMGRRTLIMLPHASEWRWLLGRDDSPWYPSARLFRQPAPGAWGEVTAAVAEVLAGGAVRLKSTRLWRGAACPNPCGSSP